MPAIILAWTLLCAKTGYGQAETLRPRPRWCAMGQQQPLTPSVVLVVEDEEILRWIACEMLEDEGYRILKASNASEALRVLDDNTDVAVLFTDVNMPGDLDGLQLAWKVHERWPNVVPLVTSGGRNLNNSDVPDHGQFLPKPYTGESLRSGIRGLIEAHS